MIYTVTLNPSIDYIVRLDSLVPGITNRTTAEEYYYGGKGINVSCVLAELDLESTAFGFVAGFTGDAIEKGIRNDRIITDFIKLESGISRINIKIKAGVETEINCQGPHISEGELERLFSKIDRISDGDTIVIAGNIPNTMPDDVYERILERIKGKDVRIVVDATKKLLLNALKYKPFLIKPNRQELSEMFGVEINTEDDIEKYAKKNKEQDILRYILNYGWGLAGQRFQFAKFAGSSYKLSEMGDAFRILEKTLLLELVYPLISTSFPILPDLKRSPKLLWLDTGLVNYVAEMQERLLFTSATDELWNGDIAEQVVGQELLGASVTFGTKRMFWVRDARNSQAEVDFVYKFKSRLLPIEVKTGDNSRLRSLHQFMEESKENIAIRLWNGTFCSDEIRLPSGKQYTLYNLPFYYAGQLESFLNDKVE